MKLTESVTAGKAFLFGAGYVAIAAKLWVFTLGAIGAIDEAGLGSAASVALFLLFVALAEAIPIAFVAYAALAPSSSQIRARPGVGLAREEQPRHRHRARLRLRRVVPAQGAAGSRRALRRRRRRRLFARLSCVAPPAQLWLPPASWSFSSTRSRLNDAGFWRGGNSLSSAMASATAACAGTTM